MAQHSKRAFFAILPKLDCQVNHEHIPFLSRGFSKAFRKIIEMSGVGRYPFNMGKEKELTEKRLSSQCLYRGRILDLFVDEVELPNGRQSLREKVSHLGSVGMVPLDQEGQVILIRQYRYPVEQELIEIPAGKLDLGEDPWECARRETEEEIGLIPGRLVKLATFYTTPGFCDENFHLFLALDLKKGDVNHDDDEFMVTKKVPLEQALEMITSGEIRDAKTIIGLFLAREWLRKGNNTG